MFDNFAHPFFEGSQVLALAETRSVNYCIKENKKDDSQASSSLWEALPPAYLDFGVLSRALGKD